MNMTSFDTSSKPYVASTVSKLAIKAWPAAGFVQACQPPPAQHRSCLPASAILVFCSLVASEKIRKHSTLGAVVWSAGGGGGNDGMRPDLDLDWSGDHWMSRHMLLAAVPVTVLMFDWPENYSDLNKQTWDPQHKNLANMRSVFPSHNIEQP